MSERINIPDKDQHTIYDTVKTCVASRASKPPLGFPHAELLFPAATPTSEEKKYPQNGHWAANTLTFKIWPALEDLEVMSVLLRSRKKQESFSILKANKMCFKV